MGKKNWMQNENKQKQTQNKTHTTTTTTTATQTAPKQTTVFNILGQKRSMKKATEQ